MARTLHIRRYDPATDRIFWDDFVGRSRNGTFLFRRDYMDYHSDRFDDWSLVAYDGRGRIAALLPANRTGDTLHSHQGLTYGGWITPPRGFDMLSMMQLWEKSLDYMRSRSVRQLIYKPVPHIYHRYPAEEDLYALFHSGARLVRRQVSTAIDLSMPVLYNKNTHRKLKNEKKTTIQISYHLDNFWRVLEQLLRKKHDAVPVHTLDEITLLHSRFPDNIVLVTAEESGNVIAGALLYLTDTVVHLQYAASDARGRELNAFPALYAYVMQDICQGRRYLDFGTSDGRLPDTLNHGLLQHKYGLGGRAVVYDTYSLDL